MFKPHEAHASALHDPYQNDYLQIELNKMHVQNKKTLNSNKGQMDKRVMMPSLRNGHYSSTLKLKNNPAVSKLRSGGGISLPGLSMDARSDENIHRYELKNQDGSVNNDAVKRFGRVLKKDDKPFGIGNSATNLMNPITLTYEPFNIVD